MSQLVQITKRSGRIDRVKYGITPLIELHLEPGQYVSNTELWQSPYPAQHRKTIDWYWTAYVVTPLGLPL